jgi:hypothetical protein
LIQFFSGISPSCVAWMRKVSLVARLTWVTKGEAGTASAADPDEFEGGLVHALLDHPVERALDPVLQRRRPYLVACMRNVSLVARPVDLGDDERDAGTEQAPTEIMTSYAARATSRRCLR